MENILKPGGKQLLEDIMTAMSRQALTTSPKEIIFVKSGMPIHTIDFERAANIILDTEGNFLKVKERMAREIPEVLVINNRRGEIRKAPYGWKPSDRLLVQDLSRQMMRGIGGIDAHLPLMLTIGDEEILA